MAVHIPPIRPFTREEAIDRAMAMFDDPLFKALQEPARVAVLRRLMLLGRADVNQIAEGLPQERSVVSRHLQQLLEAGLLRMERAGRHRLYEVDGPAVLAKFESLWRQIAAVAPFCCPGGTKATGS
ncbi:MAG: ArsR/SmtB family transcription factor [Pseudomonadota bacterium]